MPSLEYTQAKGLVQKSSKDSTMDLQGELFGHRQNILALDGAAHQLTVGDSGKELLLSRAGGSAILLPAVKGVKTDMKFTAGGVFTAGQSFLFSAFGSKFKLLVVAQDGASNNTLHSTEADGTQVIKLESGTNAATAGTHLHGILTARLSGVTLSGAAAAFTIVASTEGSSNNGTLTARTDDAALTALVAADDDDAITNLAVTFLPSNGQDPIANASGLRYRFVVAENLTSAVTIAIPVDRVNDGGNGDFVGSVLRTGGVIPASDDIMTIALAHDNLGDHYEFLCDGEATLKWYVSGRGQKNDSVVSFA